MLSSVAWSKGTLRARSVCPELAALGSDPQSNRVSDDCDCMSSAVYDSVESVHEMYLVSILYKKKGLFKITTEKLLLVFKKSGIYLFMVLSLCELLLITMPSWSVMA